MPHLKLAVEETDQDLLALYKTQIEQHNKSLLDDPFYNGQRCAIVCQVSK